MRAKVTQDTITREVVQTVEEEVVTLTLTPEQALALSGLLRYVGGPPTRSDGSITLRGILTDQIGAALTDALGAQTFTGPDSDEARPEQHFRSMYIPAAKRVEPYRPYWDR